MVCADVWHYVLQTGTIECCVRALRNSRGEYLTGTTGTASAAAARCAELLHLLCIYICYVVYYHATHSTLFGTDAKRKRERDNLLCSPFVRPSNSLLWWAHATNCVVCSRQSKTNACAQFVFASVALWIMWPFARANAQSQSNTGYRVVRCYGHVIRNRFLWVRMDGMDFANTNARSQTKRNEIIISSKSTGRQ